MTKKPAVDSVEISILRLNQGVLNVCILGKRLIYNAMSEKTRQELLMPAPKKNAAEKAAHLKHDPYAEYRNGTYQNRGDDAPTRLNFPAGAFKKALASAALDIPGAAKAQIGRLVWVLGDRVDIYGVPKIFCAPVVSAGINRAPDIRTRAKLEEWACILQLRYMTPILKEQTILNLLAVAGMTQGIGDWRQQKGSDSNGQFELVSADDPEFVRVCKMGIVEQDKALANPEPYDEETERLLMWFDAERVRREGRGSNGASKQPKAAAMVGA
jgi:hypothetical protein